MRQLSFTIFLVLFASIAPCQADKDFDKAKKALAQLEKNTNATAGDQKNVADMLTSVTEKSKDKADVCYAYMLLGETYSEFVPSQIRDYKQAAKYYLKASELAPEAYPDGPKEDAKGKLRKGAIYYNVALYNYYKNSPTQDFGKAMEYFQKAAKYNPTFYKSVGEIYEFGMGCDIDPTIAVYYYTKVNSNGGDSYAKYYSSQYFIERIGGVGGSLDTLAFNRFREGILYTKMGPERPDMEKMKQLLTTAAERGYLPAQFELGVQYKNGAFAGSSADENNKQAERWLKEAADAGYVPAQYMLGYLYENMYKTPKNFFPKEGFEKAVPYYELAVESDFAPALYALGYCYVNTLGGKPKNWDVAGYLFECAASKGLTMAQTAVNNLEREKKNMGTGLLAALTFSHPKRTARILADIVNAQTKLTPTQQNSIQEISLNSRESASYGSIASQMSDYGNVINDGQVYGEYERKLIDMCYGIIKYDTQERKETQEAMREIREKWQAKDLWIFKESKWESWGGTRKI